MIPFTVPSFPEQYPVIRPSIHVDATLDIDDACFLALSDLLHTDFPSHSSFSEEVAFAGGQAEFNGLIGIHKGSRSGQSDLFSGEAAAGWIHYDLSIQATQRPRKRMSEKWERDSKALREALGSHSVRVGAYWQVPAKDTFLAIGLPIPLEMSEIPGFQEIRGLRLVQLDPDGSRDELYSLILDQVSANTLIQVRSAIESEFNEEILSHALSHSISIANLAVQVGVSDA